MSFHNTAAAVDSLTAMPLSCYNETLKCLEYLHVESEWLRVEKLNDVWVIYSIVPDNTLANFELAEVGFLMLRSKQIFIRDELFNRHEIHHPDESNLVLGLMRALQPDLYEEVMKELPDPVVW